MTILRLVGLVSLCVGVLLIVVQVSLLMWREYEHANHRTLSDVVVKNPVVLGQFRRMMFVDGAFITFGFIGSVALQTSEHVGLSLLWLSIYLFTLLAALIPTGTGLESLLHSVFGRLVAAGFLTSSILLVRLLPLAAATDEYVICILLGVFAILGTLHSRRFIFYEMPFIFLSLVSALIAAFALSRV